MNGYHSRYQFIRGAIVLCLIFLPTIILAQSLRVIYPNGGETFRADSNVTIRWASSGINDELEIEYSTDGSNWRRIGRVGSSATSIGWTVPGRISNNVRVRVITKEEDYSDVSDGTFAIVENPLEIPLVIAPNGGEVWTEGETQTIRWRLPADAVDAVVELSTNGATWTTLGTVPASPASMQWMVPHLSDNPITNALVRVSVAGDAAEFDISDAPFTIKPRPTLPVSSLRLVLPNGGERLRVDSTVWIRWVSENLTGEISVEYSIDGGNAWSGIGNRDVAAGSIDWKIPGRPTSSALVRITTLNSRVSDRSDASFSIIPRDSIVRDTTVRDTTTGGGNGGTELATRILSPNGGESWTEGEQHAITWQMAATATSALIEISIDGGSVWSPITVVNAGSGSYMWRIPRLANTPIANAMIRVSDPTTAARIDRSDATFTLMPRPTVSAVGIESEEAGAAARIYPNPATDRAELRWRQSDHGDVTAHLVAADGSLVRTIDAGTHGAGDHALRIDLHGLAAGTYLYELHAAGQVMHGLVVVR